MEVTDSHKTTEALLYLMFNHNFSSSLCKLRSKELIKLEENAIQSFLKDYECIFIGNEKGRLCDHYPPTIIIPVLSRSPTEQHIPLFENSQRLITAFENSRNARCRTRFVVPVILFKGKFICRSATLSSSMELRARQMADYAFSSSSVNTDTGETSIFSSKELFDRLRGEDSNLLKMLRVQYIGDLMVENRKTKYGMPLTSSEKIDKHNRYQQFNILSLPYPGCEFFRVWAHKHYKMSALYFNWKAHEIDAPLQINLDPMPSMARDIHWEYYKGWDLVLLTTNYLRLLLGLLVEGSSGLLVHCISGWDRTPLFISLLRVLLWAEGLIHQSLQPEEMLSLTLSYDWFFFGHQLKMRLQAEEEIMHFCFTYLEYVAVHNYGKYLSVSNCLPQGECLQEDVRCSRLLNLCELYKISHEAATKSRLDDMHSATHSSTVSQATRLFSGAFHNITRGTFSRQQ